MYTMSGRIEYHFRGGPLDHVDFAITEQVLYKSRLPVTWLFVEMLRQHMPDLVEISTEQWPDYESLVLDIRTKKVFYRRARYQDGHHYYRFTHERSIGVRGMNRLINRDPVFTPEMLRNAIQERVLPTYTGTPFISLEEVPTTRCFECGKEVPISDTYTKKSDTNYALCEPCFRIAEKAGRAKEVGQ